LPKSATLSGVRNATGKIAHALYNVKATGHVAKLRGLLGI